MQFFPYYASQSVSALGGVSLATGSPAISNIRSSANVFLDSLNSELAASGITPIMDSSLSPSLPGGFRRIKADVSSKLDNEDVSLVAEKLRRRGVDDSALQGLESLMASGASPTIGTIMNALKNNGRLTADLTDEEMGDLESALQKLQFTNEEAEEIMDLMAAGQGAKALALINSRISELGTEALDLSKREVSAILRGLDVSADAMKKAEAFFEADEFAQVNDKTLASLLSPADAEFAARKVEEEKISAGMKAVMDEVLWEKKVRERTELVSDTRGSQLTDRAERRMRDDMTAKGNNLGPMTEEELRQAEEEEADLTDERSSRERQNGFRDETRASGRDTVLARDAGRDAPPADTSASQVRQGFSTVLNRLDVATGMTVPAQGQTNGAQQETQADSLSRRQEIFSQVEQGMLRQLSDGSRQMTLRLDPAELGQITLVLTVKAGEVRALIRADNPETTSALADQMSQLKATLEDQGLKVIQLDVETQLPQDTTRDQWTNLSQFNQEQELREQARFLQLAKIRRESGGSLAQEMQHEGMQEENSASGLHIIA